VIIHISGSTGAPKLVRYANAFLGYFDNCSRLPSADGREAVTVVLVADGVCYVGFPLFHSGGVAVGCAGVFAGNMVVLEPAEAPMGPGAALQMMQKIEVNAITMVPFMIETLCREYPKEFLEASKNLRFAVCGLGWR
jgi:acyl-CoA synthetase (AMP-forming)/AMP-acid ligase II